MAKGAKVTASEVREYPGTWMPEFITDGSVTTQKAPFGYTSPAYKSQDPGHHIWHQQGRPKGEPGLLVRLVIDQPDGSRQVVVTDGTWKVTRGAWKKAPRRNGDGGDYVEDIDGTAVPLGWDGPGFDASSRQDPASTRHRCSRTCAGRRPR